MINPSRSACRSLQRLLGASVATPHVYIEKLRQLVILAKTIDWTAVRKSDVSQEILSSMPATLSLIF